MRVVTFQHKDVLTRLIKDGYYYLSDDNYSEKDYFYAYDWMISKMNHLNNKYNAKYPIWVFTRNCQ